MVTFACIRVFVIDAGISYGEEFLANDSVCGPTHFCGGGGWWMREYCDPNACLNGHYYHYHEDYANTYYDGGSVPHGMYHITSDHWIDYSLKKTTMMIRDEIP